MVKAICVLLATLSTAAIIEAQEPITLSGIVERADGTPEQGATVSFYPSGGYAGLLGMNGVTNKNGEFTVAVPPIGSGLVSASNAEEGYPDAVSAFYRLNDYKSAKEVSPKGSSIGGLLLLFSQPTPRLAVVVKPQGKMISSVDIKVESTTRSDVYSRFSWDAAKLWNFVIPNDPVVITVTAPGQAVWTYTTTAPTTTKAVVFLTAELKESSNSAAPWKRD